MVPVKIVKKEMSTMTKRACASRLVLQQLQQALKSTTKKSMKAKNAPMRRSTPAAVVAGDRLDVKHFREPPLRLPVQV